MRRTLSLLALTRSLVACEGDTVECSAELRSALTVELSGTRAPLVDRVTAQRRSESDCEMISSARQYQCFEQGAGEYVVRLYEGDRLLAKQTVDIQADECHVTGQETLRFELAEEAVY